MARGATPPWRRRLRFTGLGKLYCAFALGVGLAAINTGNNLLFLVLGLLLSGIVVSGLVSENALRELTVERRLPRTAVAGRPAEVRLYASRRGRLPSFSIEVREAKGEVAGLTYFAAIGPGTTEERVYELVAARRGPLRFSQLEVVTRGPFGLFEKSRPVDAEAELLVFPREVAPRPLPVRSRGGQGALSVPRAGQGSELLGLRDHRDGEDARRIHWPSTARAGRPIGIDREDELRQRLCVLFDHRGLAGDRLDRGVEQAAAQLRRALGQGAQVALALSGQTLPAEAGEAQLRRGLSALARLGPAPRGAAAPRPPRDLAVLEVSEGSPASESPESPESPEGPKGSQGPAPAGPRP